LAVKILPIWNERIAARSKLILIPQVEGERGPYLAIVEGEPAGKFSGRTEAEEI